jgi:hypothetical protein
MTSAILSFIDLAESALADLAESPPADPGPAKSSAKPLHFVVGAALTETS